MDLIFGKGKCERRVAAAELLLREWREKEADWGQLYLEYEPATPRDRLLVEDLAVTMLLNSRVSARAATSVCRNGATLDLASLPAKALEETTDEERQAVAERLGEVAAWPGFGASVATKTLHKKRPALIPFLDNMAIFGAYMNPLWPVRPALEDTVKAVPRIREALDWIAADLTRKENEPVWQRLQEAEPDRSRIELFDMVWWSTPRRAGAGSRRPEVWQHAALKRRSFDHVEPPFTRPPSRLFRVVQSVVNWTALHHSSKDRSSSKRQASSLGAIIERQ